MKKILKFLFSKAGVYDYIEYLVEHRTEHEVYRHLWQYAGGDNKYYIEEKEIIMAAAVLLEKIARNRDTNYPYS